MTYATYDIYPYRTGPTAYDAELDLAHLDGNRLTHVHIGTKRNTPTFGDSAIARGAGQWMITWSLGRAVGLAHYAQGAITQLPIDAVQSEQLAGPHLARLDAGFALVHSNGASLGVVQLADDGHRISRARIAVRKLADVDVARGHRSRVVVAFAHGGALGAALVTAAGRVERRVSLTTTR